MSSAGNVAGIAETQMHIKLLSRILVV